MSAPRFWWGRPQWDACDRCSLPGPNDADNPHSRGACRCGCHSERAAGPGELCTCGRPAVVVYRSERWGEVGSCEINDAGAGAPDPCVFCGGWEDHERGSRCPRYSLRGPAPEGWHYPRAEYMGAIYPTGEAAYRCECGVLLAGDESRLEHFAWHRARAELSRPDWPDPEAVTDPALDAYSRHVAALAHDRDDDGPEGVAGL